MSGSQTKKIRNEVRAAVQELLTNELKGAVYVELNAFIRSRLEQIALEVKQTMDAIDSRQKDAQNMLVRAISDSKAAKGE